MGIEWLNLQWVIIINLVRLKLSSFLESCLKIGFILGRLKMNVSLMPQINIWRQTHVDEAIDERWAHSNR